MILAYAGRRAQSLPADLDSLAGEVRRILARLQPRALVGAAADGSDLIVMEAGQSLDEAPVAHLILFSDVPEFAAASVSPDWSDRFERVLGATLRQAGTIRSLDYAPGSTGYQKANEAILETAHSIAAPGEPILVLLVARPGEGKSVEDLARRARRNGIRIVRVDPSTVTVLGIPPE